MVFCMFLAGCGTASRKQILAAEESQVKLRSMQTRAFDTTDKKQVMHAVISTLQDLQFLIQKSDYFTGTISAQKISKGALLKVSVTVRPRGETQMLVRINAQYGIKAVEDPETYQDFFVALGKSLFLAANQVD
ncbi:MAG: hypothetical protein HQ594_00155 [Candidatus Omnitrophica bacterium]|nr:hypothetical protein [Candidatus Omnitrophota bacterium]